MTAETPTVEFEVQVMFFDTDCAAVIHNIAYLRFIETARTLLAEKMGMPIKTMGADGRFPVVARTEIDYKRPGALGDHLVIHGRLEQIARSRFWCAFRVERQEDGATLVECRQMLALVQMPEGRAIRLPEEWQAKYGHLAGKGNAEVR